MTVDGGLTQSEFTDDVLTMRTMVHNAQTMPDSVQVIATRYREGLVASEQPYSRPCAVIKSARAIVPAYLDAGDCGMENGRTLTAWNDSLAWPIVATSISTDSVLEMREQALSKRESVRSEFTGDLYRNSVPEFDLLNIDDLFILDLIQGDDTLTFTYTNDDGDEVSVDWNPLKTNFWRKHADRFANFGFDGHNIMTIARSIFATVWLESRQAHPDSWTAIIYRERYIGKILSERCIRARTIQYGNSDRSKEWQGKEQVANVTECDDQNHFVCLLSSYAMAKAIQEVVQPFKMEAADMAVLKASNTEAIIIENIDTLDKFEQRVAECLMNGKTQRETATELGVERTKIRQAMMKMKDKLKGYLE